MILGLDLSSVNSGYSVMDDGTSLVAFGSIIPDKKFSQSEKIKFIYEHISCIFDTYSITEVVIEDQHLRNNVNTLKLLSRIAGVAILCASQHGAEIFFYQPSVIKLCFAGTGKAKKNDMMDKAIEIYKLQQKDIDDNIADAIGCSYTHVVKKGDLR